MYTKAKMLFCGYQLVQYTVIGILQWKPWRYRQLINSTSLYYKSGKNPYRYYNHTSLSDSTTHTHYTCNEIEGLYDEIIITIVPFTCFLFLLMLHTHDNTDWHYICHNGKIFLYNG